MAAPRSSTSQQLDRLEHVSESPQPARRLLGPLLFDAPGPLLANRGPLLVLLIEYQPRAERLTLPELQPILKTKQIYADVLDSYTDSTGTEHEGKNHPDAAAADWVAHSLFAEKNAADKLEGGVGRSEAYRAGVAGLWNQLGASADSLDLVELP